VTEATGALQRALSCDSVMSDTSAAELDVMMSEANKIGQLEFGLHYDRQVSSTYFRRHCHPNRHLRRRNSRHLRHHLHFCPHQSHHNFCRHLCRHRNFGRRLCRHQNFCRIFVSIVIFVVIFVGIVIFLTILVAIVIFSSSLFLW